MCWPYADLYVEEDESPPPRKKATNMIWVWDATNGRHVQVKRIFLRAILRATLSGAVIDLTSNPNINTFIFYNDGATTFDHLDLHLSRDTIALPVVSQSPYATSNSPTLGACTDLFAIAIIARVPTWPSRSRTSSPRSGTQAMANVISGTPPGAAQYAPMPAAPAYLAQPPPQVTGIPYQPQPVYIQNPAFQQPVFGTVGLTGSEVLHQQLLTAQSMDMNKPQDMKPLDDDPVRLYWVRELDNTWTQRNRVTIDSKEFGPTRWYTIDGTFYAIRLATM
ncbi:hypothetical protein PVAG01_11421 [Phlyctema vagabunda]|uniref:Uncharacterized protein n=1 Tax=Phlyctema vagabunda TaxID=108571 RepID=A0ABR4P282_9HELO